MAQPGGLALGLDDVPEPSHEHFETGFVVLLIGEPCECGEVAPSGGRETGMVASTSVASVMRQTRDPRVRPPAGRTVPRSNPPDRPMCPRDAVAAPRSVAGLWPKPHPPSTRNQVRSWEKASSFHHLAPRPLLLRRHVARRRRFLVASWLATTFGMLTRSVGAPLVFTAVLTDAAGMRAGATFGHDLAPRVVAYAGCRSPRRCCGDSLIGCNGAQSCLCQRRDRSVPTPPRAEPPLAHRSRPPRSHRRRGARPDHRAGEPCRAGRDGHRRLLTPMAVPVRRIPGRLSREGLRPRG